MSAWQPLPDGLPPEVQHFVEQMRLLKDRTGLSLVALGARTAYSKSAAVPQRDPAPAPPGRRRPLQGPPSASPAEAVTAAAASSSLALSCM
jgi:hypothetical protein